MSTPGLRRKTSLMMAKDKQVMPIKKQEEICCEGENIDRPNTKWSFEDNLIVKMKIMEDPQARLHLERGVCLISFETKRVVGIGYCNVSIVLSTGSCVRGSSRLL